MNKFWNFITRFHFNLTLAQKVHLNYQMFLKRRTHSNIYSRNRNFKLTVNEEILRFISDPDKAHNSHSSIGCISHIAIDVNKYF